MAEVYPNKTWLKACLEMEKIRVPMSNMNLGETTTTVKLKYMVWLLFKKQTFLLAERGAIHMAQLSDKRRVCCGENSWSRLLWESGM